jgi:hypothetical protein
VGRGMIALLYNYNVYFVFQNNQRCFYTSSRSSQIINCGLKKEIIAAAPFPAVKDGFRIIK